MNLVTKPLPFAIGTQTSHLGGKMTKVLLERFYIYTWKEYLFGTGGQIGENEKGRRKRLMDGVQP